ncbi:MAG: flagellar motor switch protein FliN [bacterium]|jgi:flagellar motor switch protein FliN/FliY|nr:flagellar motor switch protein FliN [Planctomycetota bacterium]HIL52443.1 flagellar motor switch protein FliN [Planctomycetota bacterium]
MTEEIQEEAADIENTIEGNIEKNIDEAAERVAVQANELNDLDESEASGTPIGLAGVLAVPVEVTVRVGSARMTLAKLVELGPGSLVVLDREAHEPADIVVNGKLVARGEVVTIEEKYAVRISEVL